MFTKALSIAVFAIVAVIINTALPVSAIPKISTLGAKFFTEDGNQFYIKGRPAISSLMLVLILGF